MMTRNTFLRLPLAFAAALVAGGMGVANSAPLTAEQPLAPELRVSVAGDCYQIGQQVAASAGGELIRAMADTKQGKAVCVIVIAVPGKNGGRPQRKQIVVDQN